MEKFLLHSLLLLVLVFSNKEVLSQDTLSTYMRVDSLEKTAQDSLSIFNLSLDSTYSLTAEQLIGFLLRSCTAPDTVYITERVVDTLYITDTLFVPRKVFKSLANNIPLQNTTITAEGDTIINKHQKLKNVMRSIGNISYNIGIIPFMIVVSPFALALEKWRRTFGDKKCDCEKKESRRDREEEERRGKKAKTWPDSLEMR